MINPSLPKLWVTVFSPQQESPIQDSKLRKVILGPARRLRDSPAGKGARCPTSLATRVQFPELQKDGLKAWESSVVKRTHAGRLQSPGTLVPGIWSPLHTMARKPTLTLKLKKKLCSCLLPAFRETITKSTGEAKDVTLASRAQSPPQPPTPRQQVTQVGHLNRSEGRRIRSSRSGRTYNSVHTQLFCSWGRGYVHML